MWVVIPSLKGSVSQFPCFLHFIYFKRAKCTLMDVFHCVFSVKVNKVATFAICVLLSHFYFYKAFLYISSSVPCITNNKYYPFHINLYFQIPFHCYPLITSWMHYSCLSISTTVPHIFAPSMAHNQNQFYNCYFWYLLLVTQVMMIFTKDLII